MNKNHYLLPKVCPNCGCQKLGFSGRELIKCTKCAWADYLDNYKIKKK